MPPCTRSERPYAGSVPVRSAEPVRAGSVVGAGECQVLGGQGQAMVGVERPEAM
jgi:hypothetical protein